MTGDIWQEDGFERALQSLSGLRRVCWHAPETIDSHLPADAASLNGTDASGLPLLHLAAISPMPAAADAVRALLRAGAAGDLLDTMGAPAACWAARWGSAEILDILTDRELPKHDRAGREITHWWAMGDPGRGRDTEAVLKDLECDFLAADGHGGTPAHWAAAVGGRIARIAAIHPDAWSVADKMGYPPVFWAAGAGCAYDAVPALLAAGARVDISAGGLTPADVAADKQAWRRAAGLTEDTPDAGREP